MVNLNHLYYFFVCAQTKNVTKAAEILNISQPSLSQQLKNFELEIGFELFFRNGRLFDLTPKGKTLYEKSLDLFRSAEDIKRFVDNKKDQKIVEYTIGVSDEIERPFVAEILGKLLRHRSAGTKKFDIISKSQEEIGDMLYAKKCDLAITNQKITRFEPVFTFEFPVNLITSQGPESIRGVQEKNIQSIFSSLGEALVLPTEDLKLRQEINKFLEKNATPPPVLFESNILACTVRAIREGAGCGFVPLPYIAEDFKRKLVSVLGPKQGFWQHSIYLYQNPQSQESVAQHIGKIISTYL